MKVGSALLAYITALVTASTKPCKKTRSRKTRTPVTSKLLSLLSLGLSLTTYPSGNIIPSRGSQILPMQKDFPHSGSRMNRACASVKAEPHLCACQSLGFKNVQSVFRSLPRET